jgi:hypothetical protein
VDRQQRQPVEALPVQPLLQETPSAIDWRETATLRAELEQLALGTDSLPDRCERLYGYLRKRIGDPEAHELLRGVGALARAGQPAGARLLAALLDVHAPGAEMVTRIHEFDSARRLSHRLDHDDPGPAAAASHHWRTRLQSLAQACRERESELGPAPAGRTPPRPRDEQPFLLLRRWLEHLMASLARRGDLEDRDQRLLIDLASLEVEAYAERVSRMASEVNPYARSAVSRVLPLLCQSDGEVRSMREFIQALESGRAGVAFRSRHARLQEVLSAEEREALLHSLEGQPGLSELLVLLRGLERNPIPMRRLAATAARLMALAHRLRGQGLRQTGMDLLSAVITAQRFERDGELLLPVGEELAATVAGLLDPPAAERETGNGADEETDGDLARWPLDGFRLDGDLLVLRVPREARGDRRWPDDLPSPARKAAARDDDDTLDTAALKRLVLANLDNVSMTLGFLRNPKVVAMPGLVAGIVARCRTVRILELIAHDRSLYGGYANKDVPRALLMSPSNVSVKALQKFIHVKYVNRIDLQRMARDKAGIRREVGREIQAYLASLGGAGAPS